MESVFCFVENFVCMRLENICCTADMNGNAFFYGCYGYDYTLLAEEFSFTIRTNTGEKKVVPGDEMNIHILEEHRYAFDASDMTEIN